MPTMLQIQSGTLLVLGEIVLREIIGLPYVVFRLRADSVYLCSSQRERLRFGRPIKKFRSSIEHARMDWGDVVDDFQHSDVNGRALRRVDRLLHCTR